jgi:hypothetical protein
MDIPFIVAMAIQERRTKGKYTDFHWRKKLANYLQDELGVNWYKNQVKKQEDKKYLKTMLKEIL